MGAWHWRLRRKSHWTCCFGSSARGYIAKKAAIPPMSRLTSGCLLMISLSETADYHLSCQFLEAMDSTVLLLYGCIEYALKKPPGLLKSTHSCSYGNPENSPSKTSFLGTCFSLKINPKSWMDYSWEDVSSGGWWNPRIGKYHKTLSFCVKDSLFGVFGHFPSLQCWIFVGPKIQELDPFFIRQKPGDSSRALFYSLLKGSLNLWKGHVFTIPKRSKIELPGGCLFLAAYFFKCNRKMKVQWPRYDPVGSTINFQVLSLFFGRVCVSSWWLEMFLYPTASWTYGSHRP